MQQQADDTTKRARQKILRKYARIREGRPVFCGPSRQEAEGRADYGIVRNGKVVFNTREAADLAADKLFELTGKMFRPYECPRSRHGHHHLTEDRSPANQRAREEQGVRQRDRRVRDHAVPVPVVQEVLGEPAGSGEAPAALLVPPGQPRVQDVPELRPDGAVLQPGRARRSGILREGHQPGEPARAPEHPGGSPDGAPAALRDLGGEDR